MKAHPTKAMIYESNAKEKKMLDKKTPEKMKFFEGRMPLLLGMMLILVAGGLLIGSIFAQQPPSAPPPLVSDPVSLLTVGAPSSAGSLNSVGYTDRIVASAQARVKQYPDDNKGYSELGIAYLQKARETSDPTYYTKAEDALKKALAIKPDDFDSMAGIGSLELSRHQFRDAIDWGMKAAKINPNKAYNYGVIGDGQIELGEYENAVNTFQKMVDLRPDLSSYSRVSYARELYGDVPGAIEAMQQAVTAGGPAAENTAWCRVQLGNLYFNSNQLDKADHLYQEALVSYPNYVHALAAQAQLRWAQGRNDEAVQLYKQAISEIPLPQYVTALGDLYASMGNAAAAKEEYDLVAYTYHVFEVNGVNVNIEKAGFLADQNSDIPTAVKLADEAAKERKDVHTQDFHAWVLYRAGKYHEALAQEQQALRLGMQNALFFFHQGMIYEKLGDPISAQKSLQRALDVNPHFSIRYAKEAADELTKLKSGQ